MFRPYKLYSHYFFFFSSVEVIYFLYKFIVHLLNFRFRIFCHIFGSSVGFHTFLYCLDRITTRITNTNFAVSASCLDCLANMRRRSSVRGGIPKRIISPLFSGVIPTSEFMIAFSISLISGFSHGVMIIVLHPVYLPKPH